MNVQVTLSIPESLYLLAKQDARRQARKVEDVLTESLANQYSDATDSAYQALLREADCFAAQHKQLESKYVGEFVAILEGELIDHDADRVALSDRMYARFPEQIVLIRRVEAHPERILNFRSPRLIRDA